MAVLMICSQLLLTGFVVYWLAAQYREEQDHLHSRLKGEYLQVYDQLVDSMLMKKLVIPSLDDSIVVRIHERGAFQSQTWIDSGSALVLRGEHMGELPEDIELHAIGMGRAQPPDSTVHSIDVTSVITDEERMVKSVRLFINSNQEAFQTDSGMQVFALNPDSSSLMLNMEHSMVQHAWPFTLEWPDSGPDTAGQAVSQGMLLKGDPGSFLPGLRVERFSIYLIRSILPQILFGLILLALSASALLFAFRSLLRQLKLNRLRDDFISNISHELKTPVSTVKIALEALSTYDQQKDPRVRSEYLEMAGKELDRLEKMVERVLHHQMLNNPALVLYKEECDPGKLVRSVLQALDIHIREKGARVRVLEEKGPCSMMADRVYLEGVLINLIDNSLKYAGDNPEILIKIECADQATSMSVSDNGPGIPEEYKDQVFEKFFRIPAGNRHNVKGYGLGLNFASQVMAQHKGTISLTNLPEGGCRFTLIFPPV
jgi:signal transduction histidine kinase